MVERNSPRVVLNANPDKRPEQYLLLSLAERNSPRTRPRSNPQQNLAERDSPRVMLTITLNQSLLEIGQNAHGEHLVISKSLAVPPSPRQTVKTNRNPSREAWPVQTVGISPIMANLILSLVAVFSARRCPYLHIGNKLMMTTSFRPRTSYRVPDKRANENRMSLEPR